MAADKSDLPDRGLPDIFVSHGRSTKPSTRAEAHSDRLTDSGLAWCLGRVFFRRAGRPIFPTRRPLRPGLELGGRVSSKSGYSIGLSRVAQVRSILPTAAGLLASDRDRERNARSVATASENGPPATEILALQTVEASAKIFSNSAAARLAKHTSATALEPRRSMSPERDEMTYETSEQRRMSRSLDETDPEVAA